MSIGSHFQQKLVLKILRYFLYIVLFRFFESLIFEMSAESFQGRSLLSPSANSIRANSLPSTPLQHLGISPRRRVSLRVLASDNTNSSARESDESPSIFSESSSSAGKVLSEDEVGKHMHDHSCSHLESVDEKKITEYGILFCMVFGPDNLEKKEPLNDSHSQELQGDVKNESKSSLADHVEHSDPQQKKSHRKKFHR